MDTTNFFGVISLVFSCLITLNICSLLLVYKNVIAEHTPQEFRFKRNPYLYPLFQKILCNILQSNKFPENFKIQSNYNTFNDVNIKYNTARKSDVTDGNTKKSNITPDFNSAAMNVVLVLVLNFFLSSFFIPCISNDFFLQILVLSIGQRDSV